MTPDEWVSSPDEVAVPLPTGMRRCTPAEEAATRFSPETVRALLARLDEFDRCRNRAAVEARFYVIA